MIDVDFDYSKVKGSTELHNKFKKEFMIKVSELLPNVIILPYDVAFVRAYSEPDVCYQVGQPGVPDTLVLAARDYYLFDMKTGRARLTSKQKAFANRVKEISGKDRVFKLNTVRRGIEIIKHGY